jgi:hypothetical protein
MYSQACYIDNHKKLLNVDPQLGMQLLLRYKLIQKFEFVTPYSVIVAKNSQRTENQSAFQYI